MTSIAYVDRLTFVNSLDVLPLKVVDFALEHVGLTLEELEVGLLRAGGPDKARSASGCGLRVIPKLSSIEVRFSKLI